jgi:hypothetical protein
VVATYERWPPLQVTTLEAKLRELINLIGCDRDELTDDARSWLGRLLVIRSCGYLEQTVIEVQRAYVSVKSGGLVKTFALSWLERANSPSPDRLCEGVGRFDARLRAELEVFFEADDQRLYRELCFLVDRRNKIAHGLNEGISPTRALALASIAIEIADWFILRMRPVSATNSVARR